MTKEDILELERDIDHNETSLDPLNQFILPGGSPAGALVASGANRGAALRA